MKRNARLAIGIATLLSFSTAYADDKHPHWGYEGKGAPANWAELEQGFSACKLSKEQSPIDIVAAKAQKAALPAIDAKYTATAGDIVNNGHTIQVNLANAGMVKVGDAESPLLQFHFHTPSEESINGKRYPMVAHFVHKNAEGKLAVVAVLFKQGKENAALKKVFDALPATSGASAKLDSINPLDVLPANRSTGVWSRSASKVRPPHIGLKRQA